MTTVWKPRGPQRPVRMESGIRVQSLIKFLRNAQRHLEVRGERDQALTFEILADYFENDYKEGERLEFTPQAIGS